jgi:hypothetical protein
MILTWQMDLQDASIENSPYQLLNLLCGQQLNKHYLKSLWSYAVNSR